MRQPLRTSATAGWRAGLSPFGMPWAAWAWEIAARACAMVATGSSLVGKNPAGYLRRAIEDDYLPTPEYQTPTQRQKDEKTLQAAQKRRQEAEEEYRRTKERLQQRSREEHPPQPVGKDGLNTESAWSLTLEQLKEQTPRPTFETWLRDTMLLGAIGLCYRFLGLFPAVWCALSGNNGHQSSGRHWSG